MSIIEDTKIVDLMVSIPVSETNQEWYESFRPLLKDRESIEQFKMPAQYMFRDIPKLEEYKFALGRAQEYPVICL